MTPADERLLHPEIEAFHDFWCRTHLQATKSAFERDVLFTNREILWETWKRLAVEYDARARRRDKETT